MKIKRDWLKNGSKMRFAGLVFSLLLIIISTFGIASKGLNFGLDFTGGYLTEFTTSTPLSLSQLSSKIDASGLDNYTLTAQSAQHFQLRESEQHNSWLDTLEQQDEFAVSVISSSYLGSQVGDELFEQGYLALFAAMVAVMLYLAVRFEWRLALGAVVALLMAVILP